MVELKDQEMGDGMQCSNHPYTKNPGGICAFCLQEKLGKLVSSSFPLPKQVSSSSSSSPSFRSDSVGSSASVAGNLSAAGSLSLSLSVAKAANNAGNEGYYYNGSNGRVSHKLPFLLAKKKKKMLAASSSSSANRTADIVYKRSKSTTTPRTQGVYGHDFSPRKRGGFWSFLHLYSSKPHSSSSSSTTTGKRVENFNHPRPRATPTNNNSVSQIENGLSKSEKNEARTNQTDTGSSSSSSSSKRVGGGGCNRNGIDVIVEEDGSPNVVVTETPGSGVNGGGNSSFERKVSRSRSVGCGSRSFSGDFFERISNGFGDCTLRRVESQREGANKAKVNSSSSSNPSNGAGMRDMVRCGGIFGGFMIMTSSSSSSSSSSWVSSSSADHQHHQNHHHHHHNNLVHARNRSWGWAFASPMRAFTSTSTTTTKASSGKDGKRGRTITESSSTGKNTTPNLNAIPSLLAVRS